MAIFLMNRAKICQQHIWGSTNYQMTSDCHCDVKLPQLQHSFPWPWYASFKWHPSSSFILKIVSLLRS